MKEGTGGKRGRDVRLAGKQLTNAPRCCKIILRKRSKIPRGILRCPETRTLDRKEDGAAWDFF